MNNSTFFKLNFFRSLRIINSIQKLNFIKVKLILFSLSFMFLSQIHAQDSFGKVELKKINKLKQKTTDQSIFQSEIQPISGTEFRLIKTETDKLGMVHRTYQQYYNGIKVHFGTLKVHEKNGLRQTYGGAYFNPSGVKLNPSLSINQTRSIAKSYIGSNDVFWVGEDEISKTEIPQPELLILPNRRDKTMHLVYAIGLGTSKPELKMGIVYVDAQTGKTIKYKNLVSACFDTNHEEVEENNITHLNTAIPFVSGTAATTYSGSQTIETTLDTDYILYDQTRANTGQAHNHGAGSRNGIVTVNFNNHDDVNDYNSAFVSDFTDNDNNWTAGEMSADEDQYALDAHWGAQVVYDYWKNEHNRDSYDSNDATIASYVHFDTDYTNAAWLSFNSQRGFMIYGDGAGAFTPLTNLDVVGHEIGHGVTNANSNLDYELESGALNEGMSDIWAAAIDSYASANHGTTKSPWLINDENGGGSLRSMSNPNAYGQPDTYGGAFWYNTAGCTPNGTSNDYCGVHTNSGVLNYWFYLLANGGSGTNDIGSTFTVSGLGIDKSGDIAYRMESLYLSATSDFADARAASIQAAADLYGYCSAEEEAVTNAWYAVGVGEEYSGQNPVITVDNSNLDVCLGGTGTFYAEADYANSMIWQNDVDGSWTDLSNDSTYAGVTTNTLTVTNPDISLDGVRFRLRFSNNCGNTSTTNFKFLYVKTLPDVTSVVPSGAGCTSTTDGSLTVNFDDVSGLNTIEFSIDGGATYPYSYDNDSETQLISDLAAGDYNVWVRRGGDQCPIDVGTYTVDSISTVTANVDAIIEADIAEVDGIIQVSFPDEATQTQIKFSVDGGISYPFVFDVTDGTGELTDLGADTYDIWITYGDELCTKSLGDFTVNEIAYTQIPDSNFEAALNDLTYDNYLGDDKVPTSLVNTITSLNVRLENISDLTGIESFTSLEVLYADNNNLTSVDVSNNLALRELRVYNNYNLTSFNVANPSIIERLTLSSCNLTGDYDFSAYTSLTNFSVQNNDLTGLNIKNGNNTNFTYFDARGNSSLTCILVDDAAWSTTNWTQNGGATFSSTFCEYTLIPDANFEAALEALGYDDISNDGQVPTALINGVTTLGLSNEGISDLTGIQDFVALEVLKVNQNNLTSIDITNLVNLRELWATQGNVFSTIDISSNTLLEDFRLQDYTGATIDISNNTALIRFMCVDCDFLTLDTSANTSLEWLDLEHADVTLLDLSTNTSLTTLEIDDTDLTALDLSNNTLLTNLYAENIATLASLNMQSGANTAVTVFRTTGSPVSCIRVDDPAWSDLNWMNIDAASSFSLYCDNYTLIPDANFEAALEALGYDDISGDGQVPTVLIEVVASLDVSNKSISDLTGIEDFTDLIDLTINDNGLTYLDVSNNVNLQTLNFDSNDVANLVLGTNTTLSEVSGKYNQLTSVDVGANTGLTSLNLRNNTFATIDISASINLQTLNLNQTGITSLDVTNNPDLAYLYLSGNSLTSIDLSQNPLLENVNLTDSDLTTIDVSNQTALRIIRLSGNNLTELDLTTNVALTEVECADNDLGAFNFKNGFNQIITDFDASGNANLSCVLVDDLNKDYTFWIKDATTSFSDTYCRYTAIPDANFETALEALGYDDISADGQVPTVLIEGITTLNVDSESISDLTGIEDFTALIELSCFNNTLTTIDLSNNLNLERLMLKENSLASVNVLNNTELVSLRISDNNLTTLDVSNNINLSVLRCDANKLTTLDISNNTELVHLDVYNMATLTSLNIDANTNLQAFKANSSGINTLDFSNNPLLRLAYIHQTSIANVDFSQNPLIEELRVQNTQITVLDLSLQTALTNLNCSQNSLLYLNVKNGNNAIITEFDASGNPNLACIIVDDTVNNDYSAWTKDVTTNFSDTYCRYTAIPDDEFESKLDALGYDDISGDNQVPTALIENITNLDISNGSVDITDLTGLEDFTALETLDVTGHDLEALDFSDNLQLTELSANNSNVTSLNISNNTLLKSLACYGNAITNIDITNNTALEYLNPSSNDITSIDVSNNLNLDKLVISSLNLSSLDITNNTLLTELYVLATSLTNLDVSNNTGLKTLFVESTSITELDCSMLTQLEQVGLGANFSLTHVNLQNGNNTNITSYNSTTSSNLLCVLVDDATYSATYWTNVNGATTFSDTYCRYTLIPDANFEAELEALGLDDISGDGQVPIQLIEVLETLDVQSKSISDLTGIEDFLALKTLNVGYNSLSAIDVTNNTELTQLIVRSNNITSIDLSANTSLVGFKAENCSLTSLDITNNLDLSVLWIISNDLTSIDLSNNVALRSFQAGGNDFVTLDFTNNPALISFGASSNSLESLDLRNGANTNITGGTSFQLTGNALLACVLVDDVLYSTTNWLNIDGNVNFSDTDCNYTLIPDANFEAELRDLGYDDSAANDGRVPTRFIEVVTNLNVSNLSITDLTGIEDFTALTSLNCSSNLLTTLNVTSNTALEYLTCTNNNSLTSIDLSNNANLLTLSAFNCGLTSLDFTNNLSLQRLIVYGNLITSLDVSLNTQLVDLDLAANDLTALDVANNALLQTLFVENNTISSLDLSSNTALVEITCQNNSNLSFLNIKNGNNTNVTNFTANNNSSLSCILVDDLSNDYSTWTKDATASFSDTYCDYTLIPDANFETELRVLGYDDSAANDGKVPTALIEVVTELDVRSKSILDITGIEDFTALQTFNCNLNNIAVLDVSSNVNLIELQCTANPIATLNLANNTLLEELNCRSTDITTLDLTSNTLLKRLICFNTDIVTLDLSQNPLLEDLYSYNTNLTSLDLSLNTVLEIIQVYNSELENLDVKNGNNASINNFDASGNTNLSCIRVDDLANDYSSWSKDVTANFSDTFCRYTDIPDANFEARLDALGYDDISNDGQVPTALVEEITVLNIENQGILDITGIEDFTALENLFASDNGLTTIDVTQNTSLRILDITDSSVTTLDVSQNPNLTDIAANNNSLSVLDLSQNTDLNKIYVTGNNITSIDLSNNLELTHLFLNDNNISGIDLSVNTDLQFVNLTDNTLTSLDTSNNPLLQYLDLKDNSLMTLNTKSGGSVANYLFIYTTNNPNLNCIVVDDITHANNAYSVDVHTSFNETSCDYVIVDIDVFLQGALLNPNTGEETLMRDDLRINGHIDSDTPYTDGVSINEAVGVSDNGNNSIVDWIWVELRDATDPTIVIVGQSAILQRDGDVVDVADDLVTPLTFEGVAAGSYYMVIKHRNHLGIMTANAIAINHIATTVDFTDASNEITYGTNAQTTFGMPDGVAAMWAGNVNGDDILQYSGTNPDAPSILSEVLNDAGNFLNFPTYIVDGYNAYDVNMDGNTQYTGTSPDTPVILQNVLAHPGNFLNFSTYQIQEQLPEN